LNVRISSFVEHNPKISVAHSIHSCEVFLYNFLQRDIYTGGGDKGQIKTWSGNGKYIISYGKMSFSEFSESRSTYNLEATCCFKGTIKQKQRGVQIILKLSLMFSFLTSFTLTNI
jgi:hypothetical protein